MLILQGYHKGNVSYTVLSRGAPIPQIWPYKWTCYSVRILMNRKRYQIPAAGAMPVKFSASLPHRGPSWTYLRTLRAPSGPFICFSGSRSFSLSCWDCELLAEVSGHPLWVLADLITVVCAGTRGQMTQSRREGLGVTEASRVLLLNPMEFQEQSETGAASSRVPRQLRLLIYRTLRVIPTVLSHRGILAFFLSAIASKWDYGSRKWKIVVSFTLWNGFRIGS